MKKKEFCLKDDTTIKSRNIFNPHMSVKAVGGWVNYNLLRLSKL